jgi:hypothetical protein
LAKSKTKKPISSTVQEKLLRRGWYNLKYHIIHGLIVPQNALSAIDELIKVGRFASLDEALLEGLSIVIGENMPALMRTDPYGPFDLRDLRRLCRDASNAKPDNIGIRNLQHLKGMYDAIRQEGNN